MSTGGHHQRLSLKNFTAFEEADFEFVPGINTFVGENGTGKTHVMKAMYAMQLSQSRESRSISETLEDLFQTQNVADMVRMGSGPSAVADVSGLYDGHSWSLAIQHGTPSGTVTDTRIPKPERPVFLPAIDMMGHTKGFTEAYEEVRLDFDLTCRDIVNLLRLERKNGKIDHDPTEPLSRLLDGTIERDEDGRFYLATQKGRQPMPLVAEGLRKIATLVQLQRNGWLSHGTTLFWDEPEVNLNPILIGHVVGAILSLARQGMQIFLATHSYVVLKELDLQSKKRDFVRYFGFQRDESGTLVNATDVFSLIRPNTILDEYSSLYDRELTRSTGRNRSGERIDREQY
jgi:energy-coupling factor transporter ATP-binding protein EcfA2